jgi:hypothetical protein
VERIGPAGSQRRGHPRSNHERGGGFLEKAWVAFAISLEGCVDDTGRAQRGEGSSWPGPAERWPPGAEGPLWVAVVASGALSLLLLLLLLLSWLLLASASGLKGEGGKKIDLFNYFCNRKFRTFAVPRGAPTMLPWSLESWRSHPPTLQAALADFVSLF